MIQQPNLHLTIGKSNSKLGAIASFSLPVEQTCLYATPHCKQWCYVLANGRFANNYKHYLQNYHVSQRPEFAYILERYITLAENFFRIHPSGDFYSNEYYNKWIIIAKRNPHVIFVAYTRNTDIDFNLAPTNLNIRFSIDDSTTTINPTATTFAYVGNYNMKHYPHLKQFPNYKQLGEFRVCTKNDCSNCLHCWLSTGNIIFPQKYKKYKHIGAKYTHATIKSKNPTSDTR